MSIRKWEEINKRKEPKAKWTHWVCVVLTIILTVSLILGHHSPGLIHTEFLCQFTRCTCINNKQSVYTVQSYKMIQLDKWSLHLEIKVLKMQKISIKSTVYEKKVVLAKK